MGIISTYVSPDEMYQIDKLAAAEGKTRYQILKEWIMRELVADPKDQNIIQNPTGPHDPTPSGSHKRSKNSDSEETKSEPPETTALPLSTTKSMIPNTQNILRKLTSSAVS